MSFFTLSRKSVAAGSVVVVFVLVAFFVGFQVGHQSDAQATTLFLSDATNGEPVSIDVSPLWKTWNLLSERFVFATTTKKITDEEKLYGAIQGLVDAYGDPYTVFLPPQEKTIFEQDISGSFGGVGMEIGLRDKIITVVTPLEGSPAQAAGIQAADKVLAINGTSTEGMLVEEAVQYIRGEIGTTVTLTIGREGKAPFDVEVVRATIQIPTIKTAMRDDGIFVISLYNFSSISSDKFRLALRDFVESNSNKLILDLRGNPGGYLESAVDMASWFLPVGAVVVEERFGPEERPRVDRSKGYNVFSGKSFSMAIVVNQGSASASEILAGALQQHGVAKLVGDRTYGKGSVQELIPITENTALKVTIARWFTPNGTSISDGGLTPDILATTTPEDIEAGIDSQLNRAVQYLLGR